MELTVKTRTALKPVRSSSRTPSSPEPRADILHRMVTWQLARRQAGTHPHKGPFGDFNRTSKKVQAEGHRQRPSRRCLRSAVPRRRPGLRAGGALARFRPSQEGPRACPQACAVLQGCWAEQIIVLDAATLTDAKTKALKERFEKLGIASVLVVDGEQVATNFALAACNLASVDVLLCAGHQRVRHSAARHPGSGPGPPWRRWRRAQNEPRPTSSRVITT